MQETRQDFENYEKLLAEMCTASGLKPEEIEKMRDGVNKLAGVCHNQTRFSILQIFKRNFDWHNATQGG